MEKVNSFTAIKCLAFSPLNDILKALVNSFSLPAGKSCSSCQGQLEHDLPGNEKPPTKDQACWYLNERYFYEEFEYGNLII